MATNFISALGAGSGIDTQTLAKDLMEATREPRKAVIDEKITKSEARISGYSVIKFSLGELKNAFAGLNDLSDFASLQTSNSQPSAFGVVAGPSAAAASYSVNVTAVAQGQRVSSTGFAERSTSLNDGKAFDLSLSVNGELPAQTISLLTDTNGAAITTPAGVVAAINSSDTGLTAQLIQTSGTTPWKIVVTGPEGVEQDFTLDAVAKDGFAFSAGFSLGFNDAANRIQSAQDAQLQINGIDVTRSTNSISDVVDGVTFKLYTTTPSSTSTVNGELVTSYTPARLDLSRDNSGITGKIEALVKAYNEFEDNLKILGDRASEVEEFGGVLAGDSLLQNIRSQVRGMLTADSSTPGSVVKAPRDVGLSFDRYGVLQFDKDKLASRLQSNFDEVAQMFSANTNNQSAFSAAPGGVAGDAFAKLDAMMRSNGLIAQQSDNAGKQVERFKADLERLEDQMQKLLERYTRQFSAMESIVGNSNSLRESLKGTFEGMANAYKN